MIDAGAGAVDEPVTPDASSELVDRVRVAVLAVPGVVGLHGGPYGVAATYLPGRRVVGIRHREDRLEVHVMVTSGRPVQQVADDVRRAVRPLVDQPVHITVEDIVP